MSVEEVFDVREQEGPKVLKEYSGAGKEGEQDILFLLRPQANNCYFESILLSVFRSSHEYRKTIWLEYMANLPGEFIEKTGLIEHHYEYRIHFAVHGRELMTPYIKERFFMAFKERADDVELLGAYDAMIRLDIDETTLFSRKNMRQERTRICGQTIVRFQDKDGKFVYVVNPDIPALMTFNRYGTNSAVIMFRTTLVYKDFNKHILDILNKVTRVIHDEGNEVQKKCKMYLSEDDIEELKSTHFFRHKRLFHFSYSPFEQLLDGRDFIYNTDGSQVSMKDLSFAQFLLDKGLSIEQIEHYVNNPIVSIENGNKPFDASLFTYSRNMTYLKAYNVLGRLTKASLP